MVGGKDERVFLFFFFLFVWIYFVIKQSPDAGIS